jgi:hypothetical protein
MLRLVTKVFLFVIFMFAVILPSYIAVVRCLHVDSLRSSLNNVLPKTDFTIVQSIIDQSFLDPSGIWLLKVEKPFHPGKNYFIQEYGFSTSITEVKSYFNVIFNENESTLYAGQQFLGPDSICESGVPCTVNILVNAKSDLVIVWIYDE